MAGTVPASKNLVAGTVPASKNLVAGTLTASKILVAGTPLNRNLKELEVQSLSQTKSWSELSAEQDVNYLWSALASIPAKPQLELKAKEAIKSLAQFSPSWFIVFCFSPTINLPLLGNPGGCNSTLLLFQPN